MVINRQDDEDTRGYTVTGGSLYLRLNKSKTSQARVVHTLNPSTLVAESQISEFKANTI